MAKGTKKHKKVYTQAEAIRLISKFYYDSKSFGNFISIDKQNEWIIINLKKGR